MNVINKARTGNTAYTVKPEQETYSIQARNTTLA
jgi:hypothetical protein